MTIAPGTRLGPYEVLSPLGAGGMGEVWKARDPRLGREVAVKVLPASFSSDSDRLRRFEQEARAAGALNHPNIMAIHDIGSHEGAPYVVSELLEGETLRGRLASGALQPRKAVDYSIQIARGLAAAHEKGIVHRDLKPENIFVTRDGRVKILDFGLAKLTLPESGAPVTSLPTAATGTEPGLVLGTLGYMSPEQVRGQAVDTRSDIFSFGAVLYEMLSGRRAFSENTTADTMIAILTKEPPDLAASDPTAPPALDRIAHHCLEKSPDERYQSARDLAFDLESLSTLSAPSAALAAHAATPKRTGRALVLVAVFLSLAALAAGFLLGRRSGRASPPSYRQLTYRRGLLDCARFAPDGQSIVYSAAWGGEPPQIFLKRPESPDAQPLAPTGAKLLAVSRSGELALALNCRASSVAGICSGTLARAPVSGGSPREIAEDVQQADWTPDGSSLVIVRNAGVAGNRLEFPPGKVLFETRGHVSYPRFSPKGDWIAFFEHPLPSDDRGSLAVIDLSGRKRTLSPNFESVHGLAWSPSGKEIWYSASTSGPALALHAATLSGKDRLMAQAPGAIRLEDFLPDGRALVTRNSQQLQIFGSTPGETRERDLSWLEWSMPRALSRDGKTLLFEEEADPVGANYAVCIRKTDGSPVVRLGDGNAMALSPDGKFALSRLPLAGQPYTLLPTGAGEPRKVAFEGFEDYRFATFFPDGREILFVSKKGQDPPRFYRGSIGGGKARPATPPARGPFVLSPDGRRLAAIGPGSLPMIFSLDAGPDAPGRQIAGSARGDIPLQWTADGRLIYLRRLETGPAVDVDLVDPETGQSQLWKRLTPPDPAGARVGGGIVVTPDGKSYAYGITRELSQLYLVDRLK